MSVTVVAIPAALNWVINALVVTSAVAINAVAISAEEMIAENEHAKKVEEFCNDFHIISEANFLEKSLETPFMDKNILIKTLEEHGVQDIKEDLDKIQCKYNNYSFSFEKNEKDKPYLLTIKYAKYDNVDEKINDLNSEYTLNVQEDTYLNIVKNLKENNMEIENEEVFDDNTIVLTINLES